MSDQMPLHCFPTCPLRLLACFLLLALGRVVNIALPLAYKKVIDRLASTGAAAASSAAAAAAAASKDGGGGSVTLRVLCGELAVRMAPTFRDVFFPWVAAYLALTFLQARWAGGACAGGAAGESGCLRNSGSLQIVPAGRLLHAAPTASPCRLCRSPALRLPVWPAGQRRQGQHRPDGQPAGPAVDPAAAGGGRGSGWAAPQPIRWDVVCLCGLENGRRCCLLPLQHTHPPPCSCSAPAGASAWTCLPTCSGWTTHSTCSATPVRCARCGSGVLRLCGRVVAEPPCVRRALDGCTPLPLLALQAKS